MPKSIDLLHNAIIPLHLKYDEEFDAKKFAIAANNLDFISQELLFLKKIADIAYADKIKVEEYKLALLEAFCDLLNTKTDLDNTPTIPQETKTPPYVNYYGYLLSGLIVNLVHGFLGSKALLEMIPQITNPVLIGVGTVMTILNGFSYYLYEGYVLKKNLGIPLLGTSTEDYLSLYEKQLELMTKINQKLIGFSGVSRLSLPDYKLFRTVATQLNAAVMVNEPMFRNYKETWKGFIIRQSIIVFGGIMAAGSAFFAAKSFMTFFWGAPLITTPIGFALSVLIVGLSVAFYIGQRTHKVYKMMNPLAQKYRTIQEKFQLFKPKQENDFNKLATEKGLYEEKLSQGLASVSSVAQKVEFVGNGVQNGRFFPRLSRPTPITRTVRNTQRYSLTPP